MLRIKETKISQIQRSGQPLTQVVIKAEVGNTKISAHGQGASFEEARESALRMLDNRLEQVGEQSFEDIIAGLVAERET